MIRVYDAIEWIRRELPLRAVSSDEAIYQQMESQSGYSLAEVYQPFDPARKGHWRDRGAILDYAAVLGDGDLLDFGPGDGWPSLPVARLARSVTAVDASARRIAVCEANARRMGVGNFRGVHVVAGEPLPFPDNSFDGIMAASSVEQTPDPRAILQEFYRVLKPGGRLRMYYEALGQYRGGQERDLWCWAVDGATTALVFMDRFPQEERAVYFALRFRLPKSALAAFLPTVSPADLEQLRGSIVDASTYELKHPGGRSLTAWCRKVGFRSAAGTQWGGNAAVQLFDGLPETDRPKDLGGVDALLWPAVRTAAATAAPLEGDPPITATK